MLRSNKLLNKRSKGYKLINSKECVILFRDLSCRILYELNKYSTSGEQKYGI